jgi:glycosyltransferase involved in cell wall biosynthesis
VKKILVSKFELNYPATSQVQEIFFSLPRISNPAFLPALVKLLATTKHVDIIFISNPHFAELVFCYLAKVCRGSHINVVYFDLIMRKPVSVAEKIAAIFKRKFLSGVDTFICIHKNTEGYEKYFGLRRDKCRYVPFKANNFDLIDKFESIDGDYMLALGARHRDYRLLVEAVTGLDVKLKIIVPTSSIKAHNANLSGLDLPANVEHISGPVDKNQWSRYIAESRFVVVPLLPGVIQPAGISVYLEAMVLGKPVVVSTGASADGILNDDLAVLVPPGDMAALREAVIKLWSNAELRNRLAQASRNYARSLQGHARLLEDVRRVLDETALIEPQR